MYSSFASIDIFVPTLDTWFKAGRSGLLELLAEVAEGLLRWERLRACGAGGVGTRGTDGPASFSDGCYFFIVSPWSQHGFMADDMAYLPSRRRTPLGPASALETASVCLPGGLETSAASSASAFWEPDTRPPYLPPRRASLSPYLTALDHQVCVPWMWMSRGPTSNVGRFIGLAFGLCGLLDAGAWSHSTPFAGADALCTTWSSLCSSIGHDSISRCKVNCEGDTHRVAQPKCLRGVP